MSTKSWAGQTQHQGFENFGEHAKSGVFKISTPGVFKTPASHQAKLGFLQDLHATHSTHLRLTLWQQNINHKMGWAEAASKIGKLRSARQVRSFQNFNGTPSQVGNFCKICLQHIPPISGRAVGSKTSIIRWVGLKQHQRLENFGARAKSGVFKTSTPHQAKLGFLQDLCATHSIHLRSTHWNQNINHEMGWAEAASKI